MATNEYENAKIVLRMLIADLEARIAAGRQHYSERELAHSKKMLQLRTLELRALEAARFDD